MSVKMRVDKDGNLVFQDTKVKLGEFIRYNDGKLIDGYNNIIDIANLLGDIFNDETEIAQRALLADDTLKVGGVLAENVLTKLNYRDTIPVTETPIITIGDGVNGGDTLVGTIENYNSEFLYQATSVVGDVSITAAGEIKLVTPELDSDVITTLNVIAIDKGCIRSDTFSKNINIYTDNVRADQALVNPDYKANKDYNDGFEY